MNDFTAERIQKENEHRALTDFFENIFDNSPDAIGVVDRRGRFFRWNKMSEELYGYSIEELKEKFWFDLYADESERDEMLVDLRREGSIKNREMLMRRKDGGVVPVEISIGLLKDSQNNTLGSVCIARDCSKIKKERQRFRHILDQFPYGIYIVDANFHMEYVNPIIRHGLGEPGDRKCYDYFHGLQEPCSWCHKEEVLQGQTVSWCWRGTKGKRDYEIIDLPLYNEDGSTSKIAVLNDVTGRKKAEEEKETLQRQFNQAQKMESVGRLAGGVAHDFNNMLGVIIGYTELALAGVKPDDSLHTKLQHILKAANRSVDITRQLLAFARKQTISPVVLDLNEAVEEMLKMLRRLIGENIDLAWLPGKSLWLVNIDPGQIDQILANLCVNARDAISGTGKITIETETTFFDNDYCASHSGFVPGMFVMLAVSDNGCGMDNEILEKIFEPFFTTKGLNEGTGLGLAMVYGIVKQNNGFINVYSEPGHGTTFKIYFPRADGV